MANFYNPYMKGVDWSQGINQLAAQLAAAKAAKMGQGGQGGQAQGTPGNMAQIKNIIPQSQQNQAVSQALSMAIPGGTTPGLDTNYAGGGGAGSGAASSLGSGGGIRGSLQQMIGGLSDNELAEFQKIFQAIIANRSSQGGM
ncbi:MAG: hypothetical protein M0R06_03035 [Sphaerochaeta sp.]|jgi:hypothetical protein|nr:hypothetical protein [Sphaerochaeta sp.]